MVLLSRADTGAGGWGEITIPQFSGRSSQQSQKRTTKLDFIDKLPSYTRLNQSRNRAVRRCLLARRLPL
jgi:hypothetical protein